VAPRLLRRRRDRSGLNAAAADPRYAIAPQMAAYDDFATHTRWIPYLMCGHGASYRSEIVCTDRHGLRLTGPAPDERHAIDDAGMEACAALVGGSSVFGVGATADHQAITGHLERRTGRRWLNFGGRAYTSTQELMLLQAHLGRLPGLDRVVVMSGLNDLFTMCAASRYHETLGAFSGSDQFYEVLDGAPVDPARAPRDASGYAALVERRLAERSDAMLAILERNLTIWRGLSRGLGLELAFALQPTFPWCGKQASDEERRLFDVLDAQRHPNWQIAAAVLRPAPYARLETAVRARCAALSIPYLDMNEPFGRRAEADDWLWVDRVHLTDDGNGLAAAILLDAGLAA
jgi:hypothetical protein